MYGDLLAHSDTATNGRDTKPTRRPRTAQVFRSLFRLQNPTQTAARIERGTRNIQSGVHRRTTKRK
jgi:hypothetical protein